MSCLSFLVSIILFSSTALAQEAGGTPSTPGADVNARFDQLRAIPMLLRGNWPNNPFATTVQGAPTALSLKEQSMVPRDAQQQFNRGMDALNQANGPKAIEHFKAAISTYPPYMAAYNNLGVALMYMQKYDEARDAFQKAMALNDKSPVVLLNRCRAELMLQNFDAAETVADKAGAIDQGAETLTVLALTKLVNNKFGEVISDARKVHALPKHEQYAVAHFLAAKALQKNGDIADASAEYKQFIKENPKDPRVPLARDALKQLPQS